MISYLPYARGSQPVKKLCPETIIILHRFWYILAKLDGLVLLADRTLFNFFHHVVDHIVVSDYFSINLKNIGTVRIQI